MSTVNAIEKTTRAVIEKKLLDSLSDEGAVAVLLGKADLELLIWALSSIERDRMFPPGRQELRKGLEELKAAAFPSLP